MGSVYSIRSGITCSQSVQEQQAEASLVLRTSAIILGVLAVLVGTFVMKGILGFQVLGPVVAWSTISVGAVLALAGVFVKVVKKQQSQQVDAPSEPTKNNTQKIVVEKKKFPPKSEYSARNSTKTKMFAFISKEKMDDFEEIISHVKTCQEALFSEDKVEFPLNTIAKAIQPHSSEGMPFAYFFTDREKKMVYVQVFNGVLGKTKNSLSNMTTLILYTKQEHESRKQSESIEFLNSDELCSFALGDGEKIALSPHMGNFVISYPPPP